MTISRLYAIFFPLNFRIPQIIQGGMGAAVSNWRLSQVVSRLGQLGVVSGTALDQVLVRRLQDGDFAGDVRRALQAFPFREMAERILRSYFVQGGKKPDQPYAITGALTHLDEKREVQELCIAGNFVEVFLAREGHSNPVGINYLEKIQLPHLPSLYGAMLAGVSVVIMGAGIPLAIPGVMEAFVDHNEAQYPLTVHNQTGQETLILKFDPRSFHEGKTVPQLEKPAFLPIIASAVLAKVMAKKCTIDGFVIEGPTAGGHNAPPRGAQKLTPDGQPIYGERDVVDLQVMRELGYPFWLAGGYGSPEKLREALSLGAAGIQTGTAFALCVESGLVPEVRRTLVKKALDGTARIFTDPIASPAGFPFKVAVLDGTLSEKEVYLRRQRICDLGFLREAYRKPDGSIGYRCFAESPAACAAKGVTPEEAANRKCLCNALLANVGMPQRLRDGTYELCLVTLGDDLVNVGRFCKNGNPDYTAEDVIRTLLG
jgi:nitronate monooxygenase